MMVEEQRDDLSDLDTQSAPLPVSLALLEQRGVKRSRKTKKWTSCEAARRQNSRSSATFDNVTVNKCSVAHFKTSNPLVQNLQSPETITVARLIETAIYEQAGDAWFGEIPARYGHANCIDSAAHALMYASEYGRGLWDITRVLQVMSKALGTLRISLRWVKHCDVGGNIANPKSDSDHCSNDAPLMAIATLMSIEGVICKQSLLDLVHLHGLIGMLTSRPQHGPVSRLSRRICEHYLCDVYVATVLRGVVSPFESLNPSLYQLEHEHANSADKALRAIGNELTIRLPRLILLVRHACNTSSPDFSGSTVDALNLAKQLYVLRDDVAESDMLHTVRVMNTTEQEDLKAIKVSYGYPNTSTYQGGAFYWHTRVTLLRLMVKLCLHLPGQCCMSPVRIVSELQQCISNLIMSAPCARLLPLRTDHRLFTHTMVQCWGALRDCHEAIPRCARDSKALFAWLLANANISHPTDTPLTSSDMDRISETFAGGSLTCSDADICGLPKTGLRNFPLAQTEATSCIPSTTRSSSVFPYQ